MASFYKAPTSNFWSTTLNGAINDAVTTITLSSTTGLQAPGVLIIDREDGNGTATPSAREFISFTGISGSDITGVTRAFDNSTARSHSTGALVEAVPAVGLWNDMATALRASLTTDGAGIALSGTASIATMIVTNDITRFVTTSVASIAQVNAVRAYTATATVTGRINIAQAALNSVASAATSEFDIRNQNGHLDIRPGASKLVKIAVLRQDDTTDSYKNSSVILTGWGYKASPAANTDSEAVTFGITFSAPPIILVSSVGGRNSTTPSTIGDLNNGQLNLKVGSHTPAVGGFTVTAQSYSIDGAAAATLDNVVTNWGYSWISIGEL